MTTRTNEQGQTLLVTVTKGLTLLVAVLALAACSGDDGTTTEPAASVVGETTTDRFPSVVAVEPERNDDGTWNFSVTMTSPYDSAERYADGWRVVGPDGTVYGIHTLTHDHANEQPFTRRQSNVEIPDDVDEVTVEGRDLANGFGGETFTIALDGG